MQRFTLASFSGVSMSARPEVVAFADVGHHGHVAAVEGQAVAEDAAAGRFEHGRFDRRVHQHRLGADRARCNRRCRCGGRR